MKFAAILKSLLLVTAVSLLAACGGGSSGGDSAFQPATVRITATPTANSVEAGKFIEIAVKVTQANGANVADGTVVNSTVTPSTNGVLESIRNGTTGGASGTTVGGIVNFVFTGSGAGGATTLTFSTADGAGKSVTATVSVNVLPAPDTSLRMTVTPAATTLAAHTSTDVTVRVTRADGSLVEDGTPVRAVVTPASAGSITAFGGASSEATTVGGLARFTFVAGASPGTATARFSVSEIGQPDRIVTADVLFTITQGESLLIEITPAATTVRKQSRTDISVRVRNADGQLVADGTQVHAVLINDSQGVVFGTSSNAPSAPTVGGIASFAFIAGQLPGTVEIQFSVTNPGSGEVVTKSISMTIEDSSARTMSVRLMPDTIPLNGRADIRLEVKEADGSPVPDGTQITGLAIPSSYGSLNRQSTGTIAGLATFEYQAQGLAGDIELVFDATFADAAATNQHVVGTATLKIAQTDDARLRLDAVRTTLPVNLFAVEPFLGSPYMAEVTVTVKDSNGQPVNKEDGIQVSINPVGNTGGFTTLDDPETECKPEENYQGCEFYIRMGQAPVDVTAGKATVFVHSLNFTGNTTLTVTTVDPVSGTTIAASQDFQIVATSPPLPSQLTLAGPTNALYVEQSGGNNSGQMHIEVRDPIGQPVPDPVAGASAFNNYQLEILGTGSPISARLRGTDASGATVTGTKIKLRTTAGIGGATFIGGSDAASYIVRLSADRADNNVDNGISDAVTVERSVVVSDGRLYDLEITQPSVNALTVNPSGGGIEVTEYGDLTIPVSPDGTYSVTVGVIATDRLGNPVLPGTEIRFGLIDEPQASGIGDYYITGGDGNPEEGGKLFTAVTGQFRTAGGGVGPGDTLVIFGEEVIGNREMESARTVSQVHSETSLSVDYRFNLNDTTGNNVDYGGILPYVIGRAADGNIVASAQTNEIGVATTKLNFPVSWLGKRAIIWAQGDRAMDVAGASPRKVADVEYAFFAGVAPAQLVVSPKVLPANSTRDVTVCLYDALSAPIGGIPVDFAFQDLIGVGKVDGTVGSGVVAAWTAFGSGCTTAQVQTSGMLEGEGEPKLVFSAAGASGEVTFSFAPLILMANPSAMTSGGTVTLTLLDANGVPQPGFQLRGSCEGSGGATISLVSGPGVTNSAGKTTVLIDAINLHQVGSAGSGECTFETADGSAQTVVMLQGIDLCTLGTSPPIPGCPEPDVDQMTLTVQIAVAAGAPAGSYTVTTAPGGGACTNTTSGAAATISCTIDFDEGTPVILNTTGPGGAVFSGWSGTCAPSIAQQATAQMDGPRNCTAAWGP